MRPHNLTIGTGQEKFDFSGNYVRLDTSGVKITIETPNNEKVFLEQGQDTDLAKFDYLLISHNVAGDEDILLEVGFNSRKRSPLVAGTVQVKGGSDNALSPPYVINKNHNALDGNFFVGSDYFGGLAGNYSRMQVFNPAGSGVNVILTRGQLITDLTPIVVNALYSYSTEIGLASPVVNKKVDGPAPLARLRWEKGTVVSYGTRMAYEISADTRCELVRDNKYVLSPGKGMVLQCEVVNQNLRSTVEWEEVPIL